MSAGSSIARGTLIALACRGLNVAAGLLIVILVSSDLGKAGYGAFVVGITIVGVIGALTGGLTAAAGYQINNQRQPAGAVLTSAGLIGGALVAVSILVSLAVRESVSGTARTIGLEAGIAAGAVIMNGVASGVLLGQGAMVRYNLALAAPAVFSLAAVTVALAVSSSDSASTALGAFAAGQWLAFVPTLLATRTWPSLRSMDGRLIRIMLGFAGFAALSSGVSYLNYRADIFVVRHWEGDAGVGVYGVAVLLAEAVWQLSGSIALAAIPQIASASPDIAARLTARVMRHTLLILGLACLFVALVADVVVQLLFAPEYDAAATALRILLPGTLIYGLAAAISGFYTYQRGRPWLAGIISSTSLVVGISLAFVFVPRWGVNGAALATSVSYIVAIGAAAAFFVFENKLPLRTLVRFTAEDLDDYRAFARRITAVLR
ncbi:MAG: polysaccharide biosynthesis C-terminal domain-containing protein [Dehalococcoidia bacterium]